LVPIAVALIVKNGLSPTAVLLPAGLLHLTVAFVYRLPVPVQPLKALGAIAIAKGLGSDEIAAAALLLGSIFLVLGRIGAVDLASLAPRDDVLDCLHRARPAAAPAQLCEFVPCYRRCGACLLRRRGGSPREARAARDDARNGEPLLRRDQRHARLPRRRRHD